MIEENARVLAVEPGFAWVETRRRSACAACSASSGCGTSLVSKLFGSRPNRLQIRDSIGVEVGDTVVIGITEGTLTRAALLAYLSPLVLLMLAAYGAEAAGAGQGLSALIGILGLFLGIRVTARLVGAAGPRDGYQPMMLRRSHAGAGVVPPAAVEVPDPRSRGWTEDANHCRSVTSERYPR